MQEASSINLWDNSVFATFFYHMSCKIEDSKITIPFVLYNNPSISN
jgi:hypothetical protein